MGQDPLRQALLHVKLQENLSLVQAQTKLQRKHKRCISFMFTRKKILSWRNYRVVDPLKSVHFLVCLLEKKKKKLFHGEIIGLLTLINLFISWSVKKGFLPQSIQLSMTSTKEGVCFIFYFLNFLLDWKIGGRVVEQLKMDTTIVQGEERWMPMIC